MRNIVTILCVNCIILICINNNAVINNNNLLKTPRPYFVLQNSHKHVTDFLQILRTVWVHALEKVRQPWHRA